MSRKTLMATALAACLAVLFFAVHAADRNRRAEGDRSLRGPLAKEPVAKPDLAGSYDPAFDPNGGQSSADDDSTSPEAPVDIHTFLDGFAGEQAARIQSGNLATANQLLKASERNDPSRAVPMLRRVLALKLDDSAESFQVLADANLRIAELMQEPQRKQWHLRAALGYTTDSELRARIQTEITELGGSIPVPTRTVARNFGPDDQCTNAIPVGVPGSVTMSIQPPIVIPGIPNPIQDRNFVAFDVPLIEPGNPHQPLVGAVVKIETTSSCATEAECSSPAYDTLVRLYGACSADGTAELLFQGDDDGGVAGDSGLGWLSALEGRGTCIDDTGKNTGNKCFVDADCQASQGGPNSHAFCNNTVCLPAGTYFIEALGEFGSSPQNFNVSVTQIGTCQVPRGDSYETDNAGVDAGSIGWPNSRPGAGNGRANKEIQGHTILSGGTVATIDVDYLKVDVSGDELVKFSTAVTQPRPNNGFFYRPASQESDTQMHGQYADGAAGQGGVCNAIMGAPGGALLRGGTWQDTGCRSSQTNFGIVGFGPDDNTVDGCPAGAQLRFFAGGGIASNWCVPNYMAFAALAGLNLNFPAEDIPFFFHDDNDPAAADYGSTLQLCLPVQNEATQPTNPIVARVTSSVANPRAPLLNYFYEARAQTLTPCTFEREPNQTPFQGSPIALNQTVYGIGDSTDTRITSVITPVRRCVGGSTPTALCYETPRGPGANRFAAVLDTCGGGGTCTGNITATQVRTGAVTIPGFHDFDYWGPFDLAGADEVDVVITMTPAIIDPGADVSIGVRLGPVDVDGDGFDDFITPRGCKTATELCDDDDTTTTTPPATFEGTLKDPATYLADRCTRGANAGGLCATNADCPAAGPVPAGVCGIPHQDAKYYLVGGINTNRGDAGSNTANFYYSLSLVGKAPIAETEPNNDCLINAEQANIGDTFTGDLSPSGGKRLCTLNGICQDGDMDAYRISVTENTRITFFTSGDLVTGDTAIQLEDCTSGTKVACDEDGFYNAGEAGNYFSFIEGCLPAGDYCMRVRAWRGRGPEFYGQNDFYKLKFAGTAGCDPSSDPVVGDEAGGSSGSCGNTGGTSGSPFDTFLDGNSDGYPAHTACGQPLP